MSKSFIKKIAFVLVFTFFFQVNSGLVFALSNKNPATFNSKINLYQIQNEFKELLKYSYVFENFENRKNIKELLNLSLDKIKIRIDFVNSMITLSNVTNENINYSFSDSELISNLTTFFDINLSSESKLRAMKLEVILTLLVSAIIALNDSVRTWRTKEEKNGSITINIYNQPITNKTIENTYLKTTVYKNIDTQEIFTEEEEYSEIENIVEEGDVELVDSYIVGIDTPEPIPPWDLPRK